MIRLLLQRDTGKPPEILCLGCHADDLEIGCGGTILRLARDYPDCLFHWVVFSAVGVRGVEAKEAVGRFVEPSRLKSLAVKTFRDGFMPFDGPEIKIAFEELKQTIAPDLIFTHSRKDAHQDHRLVAELTWNTFRDHMILEYEIPKYDGDMGQPNLFVPLTPETCDTKIQLIMESFRSQHGRQWFQPETFRSLMRLRGMECNAPGGYAEAFYARKLLL